MANVIILAAGPKDLTLIMAQINTRRANCYRQMKGVFFRTMRLNICVSIMASTSQPEGILCPAPTRRFIEKERVN